MRGQRAALLKTVLTRWYPTPGPRGEQRTQEVGLERVRGALCDVRARTRQRERTLCDVRVLSVPPTRLRERTLCDVRAHFVPLARFLECTLCDVRSCALP